MLENKIEIKVYYNPSCNGKDCFAIYDRDCGIFYATQYYLGRILAQANSGLDFNTVDSYMECRGFEKVLDSTSTGIKWYNDYCRKVSVNSQIRDMIKRIINYLKAIPFELTNFSHCYGYIKKLDNRLKTINKGRP